MKINTPAIGKKVMVKMVEITTALVIHG